MHTDKKDGFRNDEALPDVDEAGQEETLRWLLELDRSEPEERLFTLSDDGASGLELTDYERAVAHRPLHRGREGADDLTLYVEEEIVISSDTPGSSDIYGRAGESSAAGHDSRDKVEEVMAIDYSQARGEESGVPDAAAFEGADLLGLSDDDDIGEKFLVIKRVKAGSVSRGADREADSPTPGQGGEPGESAAASAGSVPPADDVVRNDQPALRLVTAEDAAAVTAEQRESGAEACAGGAGATADAPVPESRAEDSVPGSFEQDVGAAAEMEWQDPVALASDGSVPDGDPGREMPALDLGEDIESLFADIDAAPAVPAEGEPGTEAPLPTGEEGVFGEDIFAGDFSVDIGSGDDLAESAGSPDEEFAAFFDGFTGLPGEGDAGGGHLTEPPVVELDAPLDVLPESADPESGAGPLADAMPESECMDFESTVADTAPEYFDLGSEVPDAVAAGSEVPDFDLAAVDEIMPAEATLEFESDLLFESGSEASEPLGFDAELPEFPFEEEPDPEAAASGTVSVPDAEVAESELAEVEAVQQAAADPSAVAADESAPEPEAEAPPVAAGDAAAGPLAASGERWYLPAGVAFNQTSRGSSEIFADFLDAFIEEGSTELEKLEDAIARWEKEPGSEAAFVPVARTLHTLKGIAKGVGLQFYGTLIHNFETLLEALPKPQAGGSTDYFRIVNVWLDAAVRGLDHVQQQRADILSEFPQPAGTGHPEGAAGAADPDPAVATAEVESGDTAPEPASPEPAADTRGKQVSRELADEGARVLAAQQSVRITSDKLDHLLNLANQARQLGVRTAQGSGRNRRTVDEMQGRLSSVRNQIAGIADRALRTVTARGGQAASELDALEMDQYSELQEAANILREGVEDLTDLVDSLGRQNVQVEALLKHQANVISSIGSAIRAARVVPVSRLGPGLRRLVRTLSADLDKAVNLQVLNEVGTLDRDDFARCQTILDHMVRNALDHGIEPAAERAAAGKPAAGRITLDIRQVGADALITLADDGRGIDPEKMRASARSKGLDIDPDSLSDEEAVRLVFHKGLSTARSVSEISGRGVGMDIVLSELQQMGGDVRIESRLGEGTAFHIRIPSTVTVNGALLVSVGAQSYAIPLGGVFAVDNVEVEDFYAAVERRCSLTVAGVDCEPAYLGTLCEGDSLPDRKSWKGSVPVLIAGGPERRMAIAVDDVEEALELVIRSLGVQFASVPGVAGAATTADGRAIVALDLNLLVSTVDVDEHAPVYIDAERPDTLLALVVDDSRTQRMVTTSQLETVGVETLTAEHGGVAIDLLNTAERLPDVVLLDVEMPVKDGIQTLREIRKSVRYGHIPVIMITSRTGLKHRSMAEAAGCNGYMGKPFNFRMLVAQISELTGHELRLS